MTRNVVVTMGEVMLRLKSPGHERLLQSPMLEATFGGSESNVAVSVANLGTPARFVTAVPPHAIGDAVIAVLRSFHVDTNHIIRKGNRLGVYYVETGSGPRASTVIYDRAHSSLNDCLPTDFNWEEIFSDACWFHVSGITPALSPAAADLTSFAMKTARSKGVTVSVDLNYRKKLWAYGKPAPEVMTPLMAFTDVIIANEEDIQNSLGISLDQNIGGESLDTARYEALTRRVLDAFPTVNTVAISLRESTSADHNIWSAMVTRRAEDRAYFSKKYELTDIVDRVGGGDSFAGALIDALCREMAPQEAIEFAVGTSALKHTIPGDLNRVSRQEVLRLIQGDVSGRVRR